MICSLDENLNFPIICKNTDNLNRIKELLSNKYPEYRKAKNDFYFNGKLINEKINLEENNIKDGDRILIVEKIIMEKNSNPKPKRVGQRKGQKRI